MARHSKDPLEEGRRNWLEHDSGPVEQMTAATALTRGQQIVERRVSQILAEYELTFTQLEVLVTLATHPKPLGMGELGDALRLHPTTAARTLTRLERVRYVERADDENDRRITRVQLSPRGLELTRTALALLRKIRFGLDGLDQVDILRFSRLARPALDD